jgi:signal transduction histidine kinase
MGTKLKSSLKSYLQIVFFWCPVVTVLFLFGFGGYDRFLLNFASSMIISVTVATFCYTGIRVVHELQNFVLRRRGVHAIREWPRWAIAYSMAFVPPGLYCGFSLSAKFNAAMGEKVQPPVLRDYTSGIIFGIFISGLFMLFRVIRESKMAKEAAELRFRDLENEKLKAQISALTAQMNPHLLFNSLNTIASTITTDPESAEDMVVKLSELYRGILKSAKGDMHSLENELQLCKSYLEIEQRRFGPRIEYRIHIDEAIDAKEFMLPVLLLQPLVENAIKHGLSPKRSGGTVTVDILRTAEHVVLRVTDNGVGIGEKKSLTTIGTGTGLANCDSRVRLKYGHGANFTFLRNEREETEATIYIPTRVAVGD